MDNQNMNPNNQNGQPYQPQQPQQPQQPYYGQPQQPQQPYYGQPQQPQQPYYGQPQQPYYAPQPAPQPVVVQPVVVQPVAAARRPATEKETNAVYSVAGSLMMLILCIVGTVNLVLGLASGGIFGIIKQILPILMIIGMWVSYASAKKRKPNTSGTKLIKVPFTISFVFTCIMFAFAMIIMIIGLIGGIAVVDTTPIVLIVFIVAMIFEIAMFVFQVKYYKSLSNCMKNVISINQGYGVEKPSGKFAAIIMFIMAAFDFLPSFLIAILSLTGSTLIGTLLEAIGIEFLDSILTILMSGSIVSLLGAIVTLGYNILGGILILKLVKESK